MSPSCLSFFKQETEGLADQKLLVLFRKMGLPYAGFAHGVVQAFLSGQLIYFEPGCPNNFSIFCFYENLRDRFDNDRRLIMHLKSKNGRAETNEEINESLRQVVVAPSGFTKMKEHIKIFAGLNQIFLGQWAMSTQGVWDFYKFVKQKKSQLKLACNKDILLPINICLALFSKVQRWLGQCEIAKDRSEVNDNIVNFDNILEDIWDNRFTVNIPSFFKRIANRKPTAVENPFIGGKIQDKKGRKGSVKTMKM